MQEDGMHWYMWDAPPGDGENEEEDERMQEDGMHWCMWDAPPGDEDGEEEDVDGEDAGRLDALVYVGCPARR